MSRNRTLPLVLAGLVAGIAACHHAPPAVTVAPVSNDDSVAAANARRDALARAEAARRDSIARTEAARRDALARAEAARMSATSARDVVARKIFFDYDAALLAPEARAALDAKVPVLQAHADVRIRIEGNADERGSDEYNLALGQRRAAAAKRYLVDLGIADYRIAAVSYGETKPVCQDHVESCWQQNRRDEFVITAGELMPVVGSR